MLALAAWRASRCPHCGNDVDVCSAPEESVRVSIPAPRRCHVSTELQMVASSVYKDVPFPRALLFRPSVERV